MTFNPLATNPKYDEYVEVWQLMRDTISGEDTVKSKDQVYLPMKSGTAKLAETDPEGSVRSYEAYKLRAEFPEIVAPTIRGSVGTMLNQPATVTVPAAMDALIERATKDGLTLEALHRRIAIELMSTGRFGLLPAMDEKGDPYLASYTTEAIRNWDVPSPETGWMLIDETVMVVDRATAEWGEEQRIREAFVDEAGQYVSRVWVKVESGWVVEDGSESGATLPPKGRTAKVLDFLPFVFINTNDLQPDPDDVPLYGLARIAIRVYRMDADYTFALHMTSEPTPVATGFDNPADAVKNGHAPTTIGSSKLWLLPKGADAKYLEFSGPGLDAQAKAIDESLKRAIVFGAQLFDNKKTAESGEALSVRLGNQHATLKTVAMNSAAGLEKALRNLAVWMGLNPEEVTVKPLLDFADHTLSGQDITALVSGWMSAGYSRDVLFWNLKRGGVIEPERTIEEERAAIEAEGGLLSPPGNREVEEEEEEEEETPPPPNE